MPNKPMSLYIEEALEVSRRVYQVREVRHGSLSTAGELEEGYSVRVGSSSAVVIRGSRSWRWS